jgi:uncharacterized membrane protein YadS
MDLYKYICNLSLFGTLFTHLISELSSLRKLTDLIIGVLAGTPHHQVAGRRFETTVPETRMEVMAAMPKRMTDHCAVCGKETFSSPIYSSYILFF